MGGGRDAPAAIATGAVSRALPLIEIAPTVVALLGPPG